MTPPSLRWLAFRMLESLTRSRRRPPPPPQAGPAARVVYAATLGELNAIAPFLRALNKAEGDRPLWLLCHHRHYRDSFLKAWPAAHFYAIDASIRTARRFFARVPCHTFLLAEIPLIPADAPARLPHAWLHYAHQAGAFVAAIQGWLYHEKPACRMDALEARWFARRQLALFDFISVQDEATACTLIERGAQPQRVHVVGNLKFDQPPVAAASTPFFPQRALVVVGSVNNADEYRLTLEAFAKLRQHAPQAALLLAPRHPENRARTDELAARLAQRHWHYALRSQGPHDCQHTDCLILDTLGELAGAYAQASVAHVGINHNVLEPLHHGRPVTVSPGWEPRYPGHPVYALMKQRGLIREAAEGAQLGQLWLDALQRPAPGADALAPFRGATQRTLERWHASTRAAS